MLLGTRSPHSDRVHDQYRDTYTSMCTVTSQVTYTPHQTTITSLWAAWIVRAWLAARNYVTVGLMGHVRSASVEQPRTTGSLQYTHTGSLTQQPYATIDALIPPDSHTHTYSFAKHPACAMIPSTRIMRAAAFFLPPTHCHMYMYTTCHMCILHVHSARAVL